MNKIIRVLITGSVQAGKDTTIKRLKNDLEQSGYYVVNTNEALSVESVRDIKARKVGFSAYTIVDGNVTNEKAFSIIAPSA